MAQSWDADRSEDGGFTNMPTASLNQVPFSRNESHKLSKIPANRDEEDILTIHRRTDSHHGSTLRTLGHAAEHLANQSFSIESPNSGDREAIRILMRLSREVFDDYATLTSQRHPVADWIMSRAVRIYGAA